MMAKFCFIIILLECLGFFVFVTYCSQNKTLKLVQVLFRHGERSPSSTYPNDPHKDHAWPGGWDQITTNGKIEEYELGLSLRKRYSSFLHPIYHQKDILTQSSYADRCVMSAQLLLAGLYPPVGDQIWNEHIAWQPIPVHTIPRFIDNKIAIKQTCPKYLKALQDYYDSDEMALINKNNKDLYDYLTEHTGLVINNVRILETLYNTLEIQMLNNLTLPAWTAKVFPDKMIYLASLSLAIFTKNDFMKKMHGGVLAKEILEQMNKKAANSLEPDRSMFLYSGHDLTVVTLLRVIGFEKLIKPKFGATIIIELHEINSNYLIKFFYQESPKEDPVELFLNNCGPPCLLNNFQKLLEAVLPSDWDKECNI